MTSLKDKLENTRAILHNASNEDLVACRDGYSNLAKRDPKARIIVTLAEHEMAKR